MQCVAELLMVSVVSWDVLSCRYGSTTGPEKIEGDIEKALDA